MKHKKKKYILIGTMFLANLLSAQPLPLSEENKATYASACDLLHIVPFDDGQTRGYLFCNMLRESNWLSDSLEWSSEMKILCLRALILAKFTLSDINGFQNAQHWILPQEQIAHHISHWSNKKLLRKFDQMDAAKAKNEALWLSYILALWKRGYMVEFSSETGDLLLINPEFIPYRDYPINRM